MSFTPSKYPTATSVFDDMSLFVSSMTKPAVKADVQPGDTQEFTFTGRITKVTTTHVYVATDTSDLAIPLVELTHGSVKATLLKRKRPLVGEKMTGKQLSGNKWKRGTLVRTFYGTIFALNENGKWISLAEDPYNKAIHGYTFADFGAADPAYTLVYDAGQK